MATRRRRAALICHRPDARTVNDFTWWPNDTKARAAMQERDPCSDHCVGIHTIVWADKGRCRIEGHGVVPYTFGCREEPDSAQTAPETTPAVRGVSWRARKGKWMAQIQVRGQRIHIGYYEKLADANAAVIAKRNELNPPQATQQESPLDGQTGARKGAD